MLFSKPGLSPTKLLVCLAVSVASTPAMANPACGLSLQGCVLPVQDVVVPQTVTTVAPPVVLTEEPKTLGFLPILAGLAALGLVAFLLLDDDDDDDTDSP